MAQALDLVHRASRHAHRRQLREPVRDDGAPQVDRFAAHPHLAAHQVDVVRVLRNFGSLADQHLPSFVLDRMKRYLEWYGKYLGGSSAGASAGGR